MSLSCSTLPHWMDPSSYPFASRHFRHPEGAIHYVDEGSGPALLFVHGTPSWSFEWRSAISHLRATHRCIALDHLGFGLSDKPLDGAYLPRDHTRRLHDFLRHLDLRDITLVVHDFGGPIALPLVERTPETFVAVVATNTWAWPSAGDGAARRVSRFIRSPLGRFVYLACNGSPRWLIPASFAEKRKLTRRVHEHYLAPFAQRGSRRAPWTLGCHLADDAAYAPELARVTQRLEQLPLTVIWATGDKILGAAPLERWRKQCPRATFVELPACGHFPQEECPEGFIAALENGLTLFP